MGLYLRVLFNLVALMVAAQSFAQQPLSLPYRPSQRAGKVGYYLDDVTQKTGVSFSYSDLYVDVNKTARLSDTITRVRSLLSELFGSADIVFREQGNKILLLGADVDANSEVPSHVLVHGYVKEAMSKEVVIGAAVYIPGTAYGAITNNYGYYAVSLPAKEKRLIVSYLGFESDTIHIKETAEQRRDVYLQVGAHLGEVQVLSTKAQQQASSFHHIARSDIKTRIVLLGENDVIKTVQNLPGVQSGSGAGNLVLVRGGDPGQNLHLLDGVPLYNVDHFFGLTSVYNSDAIRSVDLYKGAFPARFGGRTASVIDVTTKDGDMQHWGGQFSMGFVKSSITVEGPLKKDKASIMVSGRRTWIDVLWRPFTNDLEFNFYDLNLKSNYILNNNNRLYLSVYRGRDRLAIFSAGTNASTSWGNTTISTRWNSILHPRLFMNTTLTYSSFNYLLHDKRGITENGEMTLTDGYRGVSWVRDLALRSALTWKIAPKHNVEAGVQVSSANFNPAQVEYFSQSNLPGSLPAKVHSNEMTFFSEDVIKVGDKLSLIPGLHFANWFSKQFNYSSIQPRFRTELALGRRHMLYASYAEMAQFLHLITATTYGLPADFWVPGSSTIEPEESYTSTFGYRYNAEKRFTFNVELYHKDIRNVTTYDQGKNLFDNSLKWDDKILQGRGWSYGVEAFARAQLGRVNLSTAYTWSKTWRQFAQVNDGNPFPYRYDRRHNFKIAALYQRSAIFDITANWMYMSGEAITIPDQIYPDYDNNLNISQAATFLNSSNYTYSYSKWNGYRLPAVHRLDVGMNFNKKLKRGWERTWSLGVFNAYMRRNVMFVDISAEVDAAGNERFKLKGISVLQFIPYVNYRLTI